MSNLPVTSTRFICGPTFLYISQLPPIYNNHILEDVIQYHPVKEVVHIWRENDFSAGSSYSAWTITITFWYSISRYRCLNCPVFFYIIFAYLASYINIIKNC